MTIVAMILVTIVAYSQKFYRFCWIIQNILHIVRAITLCHHTSSNIQNKRPISSITEFFSFFAKDRILKIKEFTLKATPNFLVFIIRKTLIPQHYNLTLFISS